MMQSHDSNAGKRFVTWSSIVQGKSSFDDKAPVKPGTRGSLIARCRGEFLVFLGHYGWIMSLQPIDHPSSNRHGGRIYIHKDDVRAGSDPKPGDEVIFSLYADENGLGAEDCYVVGEAVPHDDDDDFEWVNLHPEEETEQETEGSSLNPCAREFVPSCSPLADFHFDRSLINQCCNQVESVNFASPIQCRNGLDAFAFNLDGFSDSDDESDSDLDAQSKVLSSLDGYSTQAGDSSDSEMEISSDSMISMLLRPPPGLEVPELEPPPGLEVPAEMRYFNRMLMAA